MRTDKDVDLLVRAAQDGDPAAREQLAAEYLPLLYNVVGWALDGHADVDDVVQDSLLRALGGLDGLRDPARFRSWLISIAMNQVRRRWTSLRRRTPVDTETLARLAPPEDDFAGLAVLRLELSGQRREIAEATRWLDPGERELLALWWLEASGHLTRGELAEALGLPGPHAAVRVQRMKEQLAACRAVVRALAAGRRCDALAAALDGWDGRPSPQWRKRIARHVRGCRACADHRRDLVPPEALLAGLVMVPPPASHGLDVALKASWKGLRLAGAGAAAGAVVVAAAVWGLQDAPATAPPGSDPVVPVRQPPSHAPAPKATPAQDRLVRRPAARPSSSTPPSVEQQVVRLANAERSRAGCPPLRVSPALHQAAQRHSADMAARRVLDHRGAGGDDPGDRITAAGFRWSAWAENIAQGQATPPAVVSAWMNSQGHRANILNCRSTMVGVGVVRGAGGPWWTQVFAAPR
ncbi:sigma-70 family RNA polymerase sigma factor [Actinomadura macrotermitis]|uniref:RNA polymerase sigma factor n=1 Tax=Actinomadura macrotermitis TaxID=2585200 RepID=A0A7K0BRK4_9ACTN|nr:sigma-70 family RNA polymerase sigma factor [Actinomadura macrotermitis]MQY03344.1 hypothetical protein [Actinomadura macrotermitis]